MLSTPFLASWGWRPTVAQTRSGWRRATSMAAADRAASVPMQTIRATPASSARSSHPSGTLSNCRWQWLSHHI